jgi:hypothetical protein
MPKAHSRVATVSLDNAAGTLTDITQFVDTANLADAIDATEVTTLGVSARQYLEGLAGTTLSISGPLDSVLYAQIAGIRQSGTTRSIQYRPMGNTAGYPTITAEAYVSSFSMNAQVGSAATFSATITCTGTVTMGTI